MSNPYRAIFCAPGTRAFAAAGFVARLPVAMAPIGVYAIGSFVVGLIVGALDLKLSLQRQLLAALGDSA